MPLIPGAVLSDRYVIDEEIGRGGYSLVYRAVDRQVGSDVAIKLLVPPPAVAQIARERMRREVRAARSLVHDHIVSVYDYIEDEEACYVVMELIEGPDLARYVEEHGPLEPAKAATLGIQLSQALAVAHHAGILHRDVKPQNILLDQEGNAHLADFGSARMDGQHSMTQTGGFVGTLGYLPPEVIRGQRPDARSDIYAVGLTLYFALEGDLPPRRSAHLPPEPNDDGFQVGGHARVPGWLADVVAKATAANPNRRYPTATAVERALEAKGSATTPSDAGGATCLLCGRPDPLGLAVCLRCGAPDGHGKPTLLFLDRATDGSVRREVGAMLAASVRGDTLSWVLRGSRALVRLPRDTAERVQQRMSSAGIPLRTMRQSRAWAPMPVSYYAMVGATVAAGFLAGAVIPLLATLALPMGTLLLLLGQIRLQRPAITAGAAEPQLPPNIAREALAALRTLPDGVARELLASIVASVAQLHRRWRKRTGPDAADGQEAIDHLGELVAASCSAARELADFDDYLAPRLAPEAAGGRSGAQATRPAEGVEEFRDDLVQRLLEVLAAVDDLRRQDAQLAVERASLPAVTEALENRARLEAEAIHEVEALLARSAQEPAA